METVKEKNPQVFLNDVADAMDAAATQIENNSAARPGVMTAACSEIWRPKFGQKLVYSSCYTLSFGICFPVFLACRYIPKNNPLVRGMIAGRTAAVTDVDAWLARIEESKLRAAQAKEDGSVAQSGAEALAPA